MMPWATPKAYRALVRASAPISQCPLVKKYTSSSPISGLQDLLITKSSVGSVEPGAGSAESSATTVSTLASP
jgi:hypothetical protein